MLMKPYEISKLPEVIFLDSESVPLNHALARSKITVTNFRKEVLINSGERNAYIIFPIRRTPDLVKNFQLSGPVTGNISTIQIIVDRQIIASSEDVKTPLGQEWLPVVALPYGTTSVWAKLIDENGPSAGILEYDGCFLPDDERQKIGRSAILVNGYDLIIAGGGPVKDIEKFLRSKFDYVTDDEIFSNNGNVPESLGSIESSESAGVFHRLGNVFRNVIVTAKTRSQVRLFANDLVILETIVDSGVRTNITKEVTLPYPPYNEIRYEIKKLLAINVQDAECTVEREECFSSASLDKNTFLIPSMGLIMKGGSFGFCL